MLTFFVVRGKEVRRALDEAGQKKALFATVTLFVVLFACIIYFISNPTSYVDNIYFIFGAVLAAILLYIRLTSKAIVESVHRGKTGNCKDVYNKHKKHFDKRFVVLDKRLGKGVSDKKD